MIKAGSLVKMKWGYSPVGVVTKVFDNPYYGHLLRDAEDGGKMAAIVWTDIGKTREKMTDLKVLNESR